jgi:chitinase
LLDLHLDDKTGLEHKRDNNLAMQILQAVTSSAAITPTTTAVSVTSTLSTVVRTTSASVYFLPPDAFPTRQASSSQAPTAPQPVPSQPQAAAVSGPALPLVMAYYPDWASFDPEKIDFKRFDWIDFAFAVPDRKFNIKWDDPKAPEMLRRLVSAAHAGGKKAKLSIGGWSGSK